MAQITELLDLAWTCCASRDPGWGSMFGWATQRCEWGTCNGNGFQGGVFENQRAIIVGFSGTKGNPLTAPISQNSANVRMAVNVIPNMAGSAFEMVEWARGRAGRKPVTIVGHSLGGALAQVVGNWSGLPFLSSSGPGMWGHLKMSAFNIFKPQQMIRSITSENASSSVGICFVVKGGFIANSGAHVGTVIQLTTNLAAKHSKQALEDGMGFAMLRPQPEGIASNWPITHRYSAPAGRARAGATVG